LGVTLVVNQESTLTPYAQGLSSVINVALLGQRVKKLHGFF